MECKGKSINISLIPLGLAVDLIAVDARADGVDNELKDVWLVCNFVDCQQVFV